MLLHASSTETTQLCPSAKRSASEPECVTAVSTLLILVFSGGGAALAAGEAHLHQDGQARAQRRAVVLVAVHSEGGRKAQGGRKGTKGAQGTSIRKLPAKPTRYSLSLPRTILGARPWHGA